MNLSGKQIILGVTGSIAAYKAVYLLRVLVKEGASVQVIMTPAAREFVGPATFAALSGKPVLSDFFSSEGGDWNSHVEMGTRADLMLVAPVTATTLGKMVTGIADNLLVTTYLSARCPVVVAPAMDLDMYQHASTQQNLEVLRERGVRIIEPAEGELASGLEGRGRMEEPEHILAYLKAMDDPVKKKLLNKRVLVTAGPTHENIDPVRFIGNHSSGKMGFAIASAFAGLGADVDLVSGPVHPSLTCPGVNLTRVTTAAEMLDACRELVTRCDIAVFNAAVSDYTPASVPDRKMKRELGQWNLVLEPTRDIAGELGRAKKDKQFFVGFALETNDGVENAKKKLIHKNLDLIVLNRAGEEGAGFGTDTNRVTLIDREGTMTEYELKPKDQVAADLVQQVINMTDDA